MGKAFEMLHFQYKDRPRVIHVPASPQYPARIAVIRPVTDQETAEDLGSAVANDGVPLLAIDMEGVRSQLMYLFGDGTLGHQTKYTDEGKTDPYYTGWVVAVAWSMRVDENNAVFAGMRSWARDKGYSDEILKGMFLSDSGEWWAHRAVRELVIAPDLRPQPITM